MNWKSILNPWAEVKRLQAKVDNLNSQLEAIEDRLDRAEHDAWQRANHEFGLRNRFIIAQNEKLMQQLTGIASLTPKSLTIPAAQAAPPLTRQP